MATQMKTQVAIMGAGPSGLLLAHLLQRSGIDSIVIDGKSREEIEGTVKAGIVEQPAAEVLVGSGASSRAMIGAPPLPQYRYVALVTGSSKLLGSTAS